MTISLAIVIRVNSALIMVLVNVVSVSVILAGLDHPATVDLPTIPASRQELRTACSVRAM